jgi:rod shape-determining protein MreC
MIKKGLIALFVITFLIVVFKAGLLRTSPLLYITNPIKNLFLHVSEHIDKAVSTHFNQREKIYTLEDENQKLKKKALLLSGFANELVALNALSPLNKVYAPRLQRARTLSYAALPDFGKLWIEFDEFNASKMYGLLYNDKTAGIVRASEDNLPLALLNSDPKCSYAVFVGQLNAPGIAMGKNDREMIVRYIPEWMVIKVGDEVRTSGLDGLFYAGLAVGKVTEIRRVHAYKEAIIEPYFKPFQPNFFYVIEKNN